MFMYIHMYSSIDVGIGMRMALGSGIERSMHRSQVEKLIACICPSAPIRSLFGDDLRSSFALRAYAFFEPCSLPARLHTQYNEKE
jgi:hypothetical protein